MIEPAISSRWQSLYREPAMKRKHYGIFLGAVLAGIVATLLYIGYDHYMKPATPTRLAPDVDVAGQIQTWQLRDFEGRGYRTIVDFRPDGEAFWQASSADLQNQTASLGLNFVYLPVPHGDEVPDDVVRQLTTVLDGGAKPLLLYCRSGRRAIRAWSLAEARRPQGLAEAEIVQAAVAAGHPVPDLHNLIAVSVQQRPAGENTE